MHANQILDPIFHQVLDPCLNTPEGFSISDNTISNKDNVIMDNPVDIRVPVRTMSQQRTMPGHYTLSLSVEKKRLKMLDVKLLLVASYTRQVPVLLPSQSPLLVNVCCLFYFGDN